MGRRTFIMVYNGSLHVHNCSPHIHFLNENQREKGRLRIFRSHVVQLCSLMSYDYATSCRTFIATIVVRHGNLIKWYFRAITYAKKHKMVAVSFAPPFPAFAPSNLCFAPMFSAFALGNRSQSLSKPRASFSNGGTE